MTEITIRETPPPPQAGRRRERLLTELRERGARGGRIQPHRAMVGAELTPLRAAEIFLLPLVLAVGVAALLPLAAAFWRLLFETLREAVGLPGTVAHHVVGIPYFVTIDFPYLTAQAGPPTALQWDVVGLIVAATLLVSLLLPARWLPLTYALRFAMLIQVSALVVFAFAGDRFPYPLPMYALGFLQMGAVMLVIAPVVLGLAYFPSDVALWRKLGLVVLVVAHGAVLLPLQTLVHVALTYRLSLLVLPTLFFVFGALVEVFAFVAFYGWGMSWPAAAHRGSRVPGSGSRRRLDRRSDDADGPRAPDPGPRRTDTEVPA